MIESVLLTAVRISTYSGQIRLTNASGFFFERGGRLFLVSSRHVFIDEPSGHLPNLVSIELHTDPDNLAESTEYLIPLYRDGLSLWRQAEDTSGEVDVAVIEIDRGAFPEEAVFRAFTPEHLHQGVDEVPVGTSMLIVGFPLGFHDTLHRLPVVRHAINASTLKFRFAGMGYFLTDARTHRGISGACVVMRSDAQQGDLPWKLLGIHSARLDLGTRDMELDEALGLNCTWFADVLMPLTENAT